MASPSYTAYRFQDEDRRLQHGLWTGTSWHLPFQPPPMPSLCVLITLAVPECPLHLQEPAKPALLPRKVPLLFSQCRRTHLPRPSIFVGTLRFTHFCFTVNFLKPRATPCFSFTPSVLIQCLAHGRFNKYFERDN